MIQTTPIVRYEQVRKQDERYSPPYFHSTFLLASTDKESKSVRDSVKSVEGKL
jgi:hypothetical protein